jgi:hypothetical protein
VKRIGAVHGLGNVVVVLLFGLSWLMRGAAPQAPDTLALEINGRRPWLCEAATIDPSVIAFTFVYPEITQPGGAGRDSPATKKWPMRMGCRRAHSTCGFDGTLGDAGRHAAPTPIVVAALLLRNLV